MRNGALFIALAAFALPQQTQAADLMAIYRAAQANDPVFAAAQATRLAGQEKLSQGRAALMPNVNLTANSTFVDFNTEYSGASRTLRYNTSGYGINLTQPLLRQQNWLTYSASELQVAVSELQFRLSGQELILRVAQAYFDVLMAQDNTALAQAQKKAITEQLEQAKRDFEVGTTTITDTYEAQARFDLMNFQEISALGNLEIKRRALQQIVNTSTDELRPLGKEFSLSPPQPSSTEKWVEEAQQNNVQVMAAETAVKLAEKEVTRNLGNHLPTLDLVASFSQNSANGGVFTGTGFDAADTTNKSIGLQFNLPLFQGGATQSKWREADAGRENAKHDLENARRGTALQVRQSYLGVVNAIAQVQALQQALISSESLLEASKLGHAVGVRTNLDVLNAQQQQFSTQRDLLQAKYNYLMSHLRLKAAVGSLSEDDLSNVNRSLY